MGLAQSDGFSTDTLIGAALATTYSTSNSTSVPITLNAGTKFVEVTALTQPILIRWGAVAASTTAHDAVVAAGRSRIFKVPKIDTRGTLQPTLQVIEQAASATVSVVEYP